MRKKEARNQAILEYLDNPNLTYRTIGMQFGITKQRVHAIRKAYQVPQDGQQAAPASWIVRCYRSVMKVFRMGW